MKMLCRFLCPVLLFVGVVSARCPAPCECFDEFVNCNGMSDISGFPKQTSTIVIQNTTVDNLKKKAFRGLPSLRLIEIIGSDIGAIDSGAFSHLNNLESIFIKNTKVGVIKSNAFSNISRVDNIALTYSEVSIIQRHAFTHLSAVSRFEITNNEISTIHESAFHNISDVVLFDFYLNSVEVLKEGAFKSVTLTSANVYLNSFREIECNTLENILSPAKTHRFYSNNFTCDCGIAWMFQNYFFHDSLNSNECREGEESVSGRSLLEADKARMFTSCGVSSTCFKSAPTTSVTTTSTSTRTTRSTTLTTTTMAAPSTRSTTSTSRRSTTRPRTKVPQISSTKVPVRRTTKDRTTPATNSPTRRASPPTRNTRLPSSPSAATHRNSRGTVKFTSPPTYPTPRKPITKDPIDSTNGATIDLGLTAVTPQTSKSPRVSRENSQKPDVRDGKTGNGRESLHPSFISIFTAFVLLGLRE